MDQPTEVCVTIDTEFSIGGAFSDPYRYQPVGEDRVHCPVGEQNHGLGFILQTLAAHNQQATFFVETANIAYFGNRPMGRVVETLLKNDQDVQLHLHPCWQEFNDDGWRDRVQLARPNDQCAALQVDQLSRLIADGLETLTSWGAQKPIALRTGNLSASRSVYRAMHAVGMPFSSNIAAGYAPPSEPDLRLLGGLNRIEGVIEAPVLSYAQFKVGHWTKMRMLAITAASFPETKALLNAARRDGLSPIVILTHPFEFIKRPGTSGDLPNFVNQRRLKQLCSFVADNPDDFTMTTFSSQADTWLRQSIRPAPLLKAPINAVLGRMVSNAVNDRVSFL